MQREELGREPEFEMWWKLTHCHKNEEYGTPAAREFIVRINFMLYNLYNMLT